MSLPTVANIPWLADNCHRNYPLSDDATRVSLSDGSVLDNSIIVDLNLWLPSTYGTPYLSSVGVTSHLVSATFAAGTTPLGSISIPKPVNEYRNYPIAPYQDGVAGWVCFGSGANDLSGTHYRFNEDRGKLLPRCYDTYGNTGVISITRYGSSTKLYGLVNFLSGQDSLLYVKKDSRNISGVGTVNCLVIGLNDNETGPEVFKEFLGECDVTPDSNTCLRPPIKSINQVSPDCNNQITLVFEEESSEESDGYGQLLTVTTTTSAIFLDLNVGMAEMCAFNRLETLLEVLSRCEDPCAEYSSSGPFDEYSSEWGGEGLI